MSGTTDRTDVDAPGPEGASSGGRPPGTAFRPTRRAATAAQALIAGQTATQLALAAAGGSHSGLFAAVVPVTALLLVGSTVAFLVWFLACRANAELLVPGSQRYTDKLAVCGFLVPVLWWIPVRATLDIRDASGSSRGTALIVGWWAAFVAKVIGSVVVDGGGYTPYDVVSGVLAAVLAIAVIRRITAGLDAAAGAGPAARPSASVPAV